MIKRLKHRISHIVYCVREVYTLIVYRDRMTNGSCGWPSFYLGKKWYSIDCQQTGIGFKVTNSGEVRSGDMRRSYPIKIREFVIHPFSVANRT